jgi:cytochrome bd-type quinol oxidase subunit 2
MSAETWAVVLTVLVAGWLVLDGAVQGACATLLQERGHEPHLAGRLWRNMWDVVLVVASIMLAGSWGALLGVAWGNGLAALGLGIVAVVVSRLHGDAVVAWRLRRTGPLPVIVTTVMIVAPVVGTALAAWSRLVEGAISPEVMAPLGVVALVALPLLLALQVLAWRRVSRPLGKGDVRIF